MTDLVTLPNQVQDLEDSGDKKEDPVDDDKDVEKNEGGDGE